MAPGFSTALLEADDDDWDSAAVLDRLPPDSALGPSADLGDEEAYRAEAMGSVGSAVRGREEGRTARRRKVEVRRCIAMVVLWYCSC